MHSTEFTFRPRIRLLQISQMPGFMVYLKMGIFAFTFSNVKEIVIFVFCA